MASGDQSRFSSSGYPSVSLGDKSASCTLRLYALSCTCVSVQALLKGNPKEPSTRIQSHCLTLPKVDLSLARDNTSLKCPWYAFFSLEISITSALTKNISHPNNSGEQSEPSDKAKALGLADLPCSGQRTRAPRCMAGWGTFPPRER